MIDKITLKNRESGNDAFPYTWDSIVGRTGGTTVKDALDALEAGGAGGSCDVLVNSASDFTTIDTIYGIKDDIDLGNSTVNIPNGSVLKFIGGSLRNGTLNFGQNVNIDADDVKIFYDIKFDGDCKGNVFRSDWFVSNYADEIADDQPDATAELQDMFDSGVQKVYLTNNHHYRLTDTVFVDASISIDGKLQHTDYNNKDKFIFGHFDSPLITIKSQIKEVAASKAAGTYTTTDKKDTFQTFGCTIKNLYLRRFVADGDLSEENEFKRTIPTLYIDCTESAIWGLDITAVMYANKISGSIHNESSTNAEGTLCGYTGVEVKAGPKPASGGSNRYCYFTKIHGFFQNFYTAVRVTPNGGDITSFYSDFSSSGVYGGIIGTKANISGDHQVAGCTLFDGDAYFNIAGTCDFKGYIVDTRYGNSHPYAVPYSIRAEKFINCGWQNDCIADNAYTLKNESRSTLNPRGNVNLWANLIPDAFYNNVTNYSSNGIRQCKFKVFSSISDYLAYYIASGANTSAHTSSITSSNADEILSLIPGGLTASDISSTITSDGDAGVVLTSENTENFDYLFVPDKTGTDNTSGANYDTAHKPSYYNGGATKVVYFTCSTYTVTAASIVVMTFAAKIQSIGIFQDGKLYLFDKVSSYYAPIVVPFTGNSNTRSVEVVVVYESDQTHADIPYIGICTTGVGNMIGPWGGRISGDLTVKNLTVTGTFSSGSGDDSSGITPTIAIGPRSTDMARAYLSHPVMARRIGDGLDDKQFVIAHFSLYKSTASLVFDRAIIKIQNLKYGNGVYPSETTVVIGCTGNTITNPIVVLNGTRSLNGQVINVYKKITDDAPEYVITSDNLKDGSMTYASSPYGITLYDDIDNDGSFVEGHTIDGITIGTEGGNRVFDIDDTKWELLTKTDNTTVAGATTQTT